VYHIVRYNEKDLARLDAELARERIGDTDENIDAESRPLLIRAVRDHDIDETEPKFEDGKPREFADGHVVSSVQL